MKRALWILIGLLASFAVVTTSALAMIGGQEEIGIAAPKASYTVKAAMRVMSEGVCTYDLLAGQHTVVGKVEVWKDASYLYVRYSTNAGWALCSTHLALASSPNDLNDFPQANGNPIPGKFKYKKNHTPFAYEWTYKIALASVPPYPYVGGCIYIAAHAKVCQRGEMEVTYPTAGSAAYFPEVTLTGANGLDGVYHGWCVDTDQTIAQHTPYCVRIYSSYDPLGAALVEHPENLDLVNWIINQDFVGKASPGGYGIYTYGDVQRAIWTLIEDNMSSSGIGDWSANRVNEIVAAAYANGEGFKPSCAQKLALILQPVDCATRAPLAVQVIIIEVEGHCEKFKGYETAWGAERCSSGYCTPFPGNNWAYYLQWCGSCY